MSWDDEHVGHRLTRSVVIRATRETVFRFFTDSAAFARWWGEGSHIEGRPGGAVFIRYPNGVVARGEVREIASPNRIVFTYGYEDEDRPIGPGESLVTVTLEETSEGTRLELTHAFEDEQVRDQHVPGWRYQLAVFANVATEVQHEGLGEKVDRYFAAWSEKDEGARRQAFQEVLAEDVRFRDGYACVQGLEDLVAHVQAAQAHGVAAALERRGTVRHCQGTAVVDWRARASEGVVVMQGASVIELRGDGKMQSICGLLAPVDQEA